MNDLTPKEMQRVVTQLAVLEQEIDRVLFARRPNDDDEDDGHPIAAGVGTGIVAGGVGAGGYYGAQALRAKGRQVNAAKELITTSNMRGADSSAGGKVLRESGGRGFIVNPEQRFTLPGTAQYGPMKPAGFLGDVKAGAGAVAGDAKVGLTDAWKSLMARLGKKAVKAAV